MSVVGGPRFGIVQAGLVLNLDAGNTLSYPGTGTNWFDLTSNNNDGVLVNGPIFDSVNGGSIEFDGVNDYVRIANNSNLQFGTGSFTAFAWIYPDFVGNVRIINNRGTGGGGQYKGYQFKITYSGPNWYIYDSSIDDASGNSKNCNGCGSTYPRNKWYYVNMVYETQNELRFYVNGELDGTVRVGTYGSITNSLPTAIGAAIVNTGVEGSLSQTYDGKIAHVGLYNKALTASEITQNYNATKGRFGL